MTRIYRVETAAETKDFTNYRAAGRLYRKHDGFKTASTWRVSHDHKTVYERLDSTGDTPAWAFDPKFTY